MVQAINPKSIRIENISNRRTNALIVAFVSLSVAPGADEEIVRDLVRDSIVEEAWLTTGEFDVLLVLKAKDTEEINKYVNDDIRSIEGVIRAVVTFGLQSIKSEG